MYALYRPNIRVSWDMLLSNSLADLEANIVMR